MWRALPSRVGLKTNQADSPTSYSVFVSGVSGMNRPGPRPRQNPAIFYLTRQLLLASKPGPGQNLPAFAA